MPRLRHLLDSMLLGLIERRSGDRPSDQPPRNAASTQREIDALTVLVRERDAEIERLKATDAKRSSILRKNAATRRQKRHETKDLRRKNRAQLRLLKKRRGKLRVLMQRLRDMKPIFAAQSASKSLAGETLPLPFDQPPARTLIEWLYRKLANASLWPWRHWMRLGYHSQYDPRPLVLDRIPAPHSTPAAWPRISLVTPSYQQAAFLERTMCSVLDQNYPNLEYFVLDGGSRDGSVESIRQYASRLAGWRSKPDGGQAAAVREGLDQATGDIMAWLNSDDVIFPGTLAYVADYFMRHPDVDVVYGHRIILNSHDYEIARWILPAHDPEFLSWADFIPQECTFWRRRIYERVGGIDPSFKFALDWDLFLRFQRAGAKMVRLPYFLGGFRVHPDQKNIVKVHIDGHQEMQRIRKEVLGELYNRDGLNQRLNWFQAKGVFTTLLWRFGIRW